MQVSCIAHCPLVLENPASQPTSGHHVHAPLPSLSLRMAGPHCTGPVTMVRPRLPRCCWPRGQTLMRRTMWVPPPSPSLLTSASALLPFSSTLLFSSPLPLPLISCHSWVKFTLKLRYFIFDIIFIFISLIVNLPFEISRLIYSDPTCWPLSILWFIFDLIISLSSILFFPYTVLLYNICSVL